MDAFHVDKFVGGHGLIQILPPVIQQPLFADETEPGREQLRFVFHHFDKTIGGDPLDGFDFVWVRHDGKF